ncbi:hypothetical protein CANARDRAFT_195802 [[Candida] arabinofermentans NRRL YB-2248]|uniref:Elongation factor methyltransferase 7 n=1 Tax=[Candida] arabinofermentans NRRL YB-2248 TaxID=983967 RepID=A0A1E4T4L7_9ASCO|nr:hypothetical protein CANARDRAFT_195802 [[Candida] arabinofermentans NRRL YB-2248]
MSDSEIFFEGDMFEEPADFRPPPPEAHFVEYSRKYSTPQSHHNIDTVKLRLVGKSPLWGHLLWNAGIYTANYIEKHGLEDIKGKKIVEFGAAAALPSLLCALNGAKTVVTTDYPDNDLLDNIRYNVEHLPFEPCKEIIKVDGFIWGHETDDIKELLQEQDGKADFLIMSDLVFNHSEHHKLLKSCKELIKPLNSAKDPRSGGKCLVVWSPHRPTPQMVENDFKFFSDAAEMFDFDVEFVEMVHWDHPMFPEDPVETEEIRKRVLNLPTLDLKNSIKITIDNEQDSNYSSEGDNISEDEPGFGKITKKLNFNVPSTPKGQITDEKYAYDLHIKEGNNIDEEDYETSVKVKELVNPFLVNDGGDDNNRSKSNVSKSQPSRFDHEIELVHSKTGKKIVRQMDEFEKAIKPKRLSFDHVIETPSTPENKIMLNPLNERSPIEDDTNNGELIRKEKINNPFKVPSKFSSFKTHSTKKPLIFGSLSDLDVDDESQAMSSSNVVSKESREIVYINNKTGERVTQEMDYDQLKIKPKKLNFDGC